MKYPEDFINKVICGDCLEVMKEIPDNSVDLVLTSPPYNIGFDYGGKTNDKRDDYESWCREWFKELQGISKNQCIAVGIPNIGMWYKIKQPKWMICWWKPAAMGRSPFGFCNWEPLLFWGKPTKRKGCDVIRAIIKPDKMLEKHPCPKPLDWGLKLIELLTNENDTILDPFLGSGTVAVAAQNLGRNFIGIEISEDYCKIARERLRQKPLF